MERNERDLRIIKAICISRLEQEYMGRDTNDYIFAKSCLDMELQCVEENDYSSVIMDGWVLAKETQERTGIAVAKGPAASSVINYLLGITSVNPIMHNLDNIWYFGLNGERPPVYEFAETIDDILKADNCCEYREYVYEELISHDISREKAYEITEFIRKGKAHYRIHEKKWEKYKELLIKCGISDNSIEKYEKYTYFGTISFHLDSSEKMRKMIM